MEMIIEGAADNIFNFFGQSLHCVRNSSSLKGRVRRIVNYLPFRVMIIHE